MGRIASLVSFAYSQRIFFGISRIRITRPACRPRPRSRYVLGNHGAGPNDTVVADADAAQDAGAVADPDVVRRDVALVDPL